MKLKLVWLLFFSLVPCLALADGGSDIPVYPQEDFEGVINDLADKVLPKSGGDGLFYRDTKNLRIGIGVTSPTVKLDVAGDVRVDGFIYSSRRTTAQLDAATASQTGGLVYNTTITRLCISTGTGAGAFVRVDDSTTACR